LNGTSSGAVSGVGGNALAYGANTCVAVGNTIYYKTGWSGQWVQAVTTAPGAGELNGLAYGNNTWVVVGSSGNIAYSED
jgi:hypothetical protein